MAPHAAPRSGWSEPPGRPARWARVSLRGTTTARKAGRVDGIGPVTVARRLVVVSVDDYGDGDVSFASDIATQVGVVTGWLTNPSLPPEHAFSLHSPTQLKGVRDLREFLLATDLTAAVYDEALVVYITGHGLRGVSGRHYLTFGGTDHKRLMGTAFPTGELVAAVLDSEAEHILVLVDSCFSGALHGELHQLLTDLSAVRRKLPTVAVVTSGHFDEQPHVGEFTELLARTLARINDESSGYTDSHLSFEEWERLLKTVGEENPGLIEALWAWPPSRRHVPSACLPNPAHRPQTAVGVAVAGLALTSGALDRYWIARASGQVGEDDPGWYFRGRTELVRDMIAFLRDGTGALVVTGAAGSGKSALLAQLVTLTDSTFLRDPRAQNALAAVPADLRPVPDSVHAAVLARGKTALTLIEDLHAALDTRPTVGVPPLQSLLAHLQAAHRTAEQPLTVVIDGLDEAEEPLACLSDVVLPIGRLGPAHRTPLVRLVLGMRSSLPAASASGHTLRDEAADQLLDALHTMAAGDGAERQVPLTVLRTDEAASSEADIALYVQALLTGHHGSPYRDSPQAAGEAAAVVAAAVQPSFLDARLAADQLRSAGQVQDLEDAAWRRRLQDGTAALLQEDLRAVAAAQEVQDYLLLAVLRATAFAPGSGLPWAEVWPAAVRGVLGPGGHDLLDVDRAIRVFRHSRLVGYLAGGQEDGRVTYRPVHQRITETLIARPHALLPEAGAGVPVQWQEAAVPGLAPAREVERSLAAAFAALARSARPYPPHPYVRRHLVGHAAAGGVLDDEHVPLEVLVHETSRTLRSRLGLPLPTGDEDRRSLTAAALVEPYLQETLTPASRADSIAFHITALGGTAENLPMPAVGPQLRTQWAHWAPRPNVLASPRGTVRAMCALTAPDGRSLVAAATRHGVDVWDVASGHSLAHLQAGQVLDMHPIRGSSGRMFLVTAGPRRAAVWDPLSGRKVSSLALAQRVSGVRILADGEERWKVALVSVRGVLLWAPTEGWSEDFAVPVWPGKVGRANLVDVVRLELGRAVLVFVSERGLRVWDPRTPLRVRELDHPLPGARAMVALRRSDGDVVAVAHHEHHLVSLWDCSEGSLVGSVVTAANRLAVLPRPGQEPLLVTEAGGVTEVWRTGVLTSRLPERVGRVHTGDIHALVAVPEPSTRPDGLPLLATAGDEGLRLWASARHPSTAPGLRPTDSSFDPMTTARPRTLAAVSALYRSRPHGLLTVGTSDGLDVHDPATGHRISRIVTQEATRALQTFPSRGAESLLARATPSRLETWDLRGERMRDFFGIRGARAWTTFALPDGSPALVTATPEHFLVRDVADHHDWAVPRFPFGRDQRPSSTSLVVVPSGDDRFLAVGTQRGVDVWNLASGHPVARLRQTYPGRVAAMTLVPTAADVPLLAVATAHGIHLWDTDRWALRTDIEAQATRTVTTLATPEGNLLVYGNGSGVHLWDGLSDTPVHSLLTAAAVLNITAAPGTGTPALYISGPAGTSALRLTY
ncbi:AAA family ATPase [Kitasatospora purpeofusca]|uniref:AAA family ATPase n=1 Tax=Kitasatospora purpeofusca TaxID=67352 RepID=UPI0033DA4C2F